MSDNNRRVSYQPTGIRDVYWCHHLNEPVIVEYQLDGNERRSFCANCTQLDITGDDAHTFVCHVNKPPYAKVENIPMTVPKCAIGAEPSVTDEKNPWPMTTTESAPLDATELPLTAVLNCVRSIARRGVGVLAFPTWSVEVMGRFLWRGLMGAQLGVLDAWAGAHRGRGVEGGPIPTTDAVIANAIDVALRVLNDPKLDLSCLADYRAILDEYTATGAEESVREAVHALLVAIDTNRRP